MRSLSYVLDGDNLVPATGDEWSAFFKNIDNRRVARIRTHRERHGGCPVGMEVSTVFLGLDHGSGPEHPVLWETMVFPKDTRRELYCERYSSAADARLGHARIVSNLKEGKNPRKRGILELEGLGAERVVGQPRHGQGMSAQAYVDSMRDEWDERSNR